MDHKTNEEIIASIEGKDILELKNLTDLLLKEIAGAETEEERKAREWYEAWKTPWYTLSIVGLKVTGAREKALLVKSMREVLHCSLGEAMTIIKTLPCEVVSTIGEYPLDCMEKYRPLKEALEALGLVTEENYHYGNLA